MRGRGGVTLKVAPLSNRSVRTVRSVRGGEERRCAVRVLLLHRFGLKARRLSAPPFYSKSRASVGLLSRARCCGGNRPKSEGAPVLLPRGTFTRRGHTCCPIVSAFLFHLGHSSSETLTVITCSFDLQPTCPSIVLRLGFDPERVPSGYFKGVTVDRGSGETRALYSVVEAN